MIRAPDGTVYDLEGPPDAPMVALIHGLGLNRAVWDQTVPALSGTFQVLSYDMLGHGQTPAPEAAPNLAMLAGQVAGLLDHLGVQKAALVGFSLGGMIARRFAQDYPSRTLALAILHSPHRRTPDAQAAILARVAQARRDGPASTVEAALERWFTDPFRLKHPEVMDRVRGWVLSNDPATYPSFYEILATGIAEIVAPQPPIAAPTLVVTGDQDFGNGPEMTHAIAGEVAGAQTIILPGLRHMALMEEPALTNAALLSFLSKAVPHG
jgi:pimeloyl-ACP methyl ester carboxylesterase